MTKNDHGKDVPAASKDEMLTRRMAMKRIAIGLAGVGVVAVSGIIGHAKPVWGADYSDAARERDERSGPWDAPYSDAARESDQRSDVWDQYSDAKS